MLVWFFLFQDSPREAPYNTLLVEARGIKSEEGTLRLAVFTSPIGFPEDYRRAHIIKAIPVVGSRHRYAFKIPFRYKRVAVAAYHDKNDNQKVDKNIFGAPVEAYGFSQNTRPYGRAPKFSEAAVPITQDTELRIQLE